MTSRSGLHWLRPVLHKFRKACYRILGIHHVMDAQRVAIRNGDAPEHQEQMQRVMDRVVLLESLVNWRLYGLPGKTGSFSFELAASLGQSVEIKRQIQDLVEWGWNHDEFAVLERCLEQVPSQARVCLLLSPELAGKTCQLREIHREKSFTFVSDPADLLSISYHNKAMAQDSTILETSLFNAISAFPQQHFDFIWLSDSILQADGLRVLALLERVRQSLHPDGLIGMRLKSDTRPLITQCLQDAAKLVQYWSKVTVGPHEKYLALKISGQALVKISLAHRDMA